MRLSPVCNTPTSRCEPWHGKHFEHARLTDISRLWMEVFPQRVRFFGLICRPLSSIDDVRARCERKIISLQ